MNKLTIYREAALLLEEEGYEAEVREDYSGRGMYGNTVPAIVTEANPVRVGWAITSACVQHAQSEDTSPDWALDDAGNLLPDRQDSMGRSSSVYY